MSNIDKQAVQAVADLKAGYTLGHADVELIQQMALDAVTLLDELEAAEALNKHLELAIRKADGCSEALRRKTEASEKRIAELEAREVVLPQRISMEGGAYCTAHARYDEDGDFYYRDDVIESLVAAGIITKVGD